MSHITRDDVLKLARLSRLTLAEDEINHFVRELSSIVEYIEQLQAVDTEGLTPTNQVTGLVNVTRPDIVKDYGATPADLLKNAPAVEEDQIKVKRMIV
jgi:aspartyl-tRNA(Asn)/glutamyl-tRNA(Gln) amidotransferase subunit C